MSDSEVPVPTRISNIDAVQGLANLVQRLQDLAAPDGFDHSDQSLEDFLRVKSVGAFLKEAIETWDPNLLSPRALRALDPHLAALDPLLTELETSFSQESLNQVNAGLDTALISLPPLAVLSARAGYREETPSHYFDAFSSALETVRSRATDVRSELDGLHSNIEATDEEYRGKLSTLETAITEASNVVDTQKTRLDEAVTQQVDSFGVAQESRQKEFAEFIAARQKDFDGQLQSQQRGHEELVKQQQSSATEILEEMEDLKGKSKRLAALISRATLAGGYEEHSQAGGYEEHSQSQRWSARIWSATTVLSFLGLAIVGVILYETEPAGDFFDIRRLLIATPFLLLAGFAAAQANHHRNLAQYNKQVELEIAALGPYLESLEKTDRQEAIVEYMALRIFGNLSPPDSKAASITPEGIQELLKPLRRRSAGDENDVG
jgi:hypothetical protein